MGLKSFAIGFTAVLGLSFSAFGQTTYVNKICFTDGTGTPTNNCIVANGFTKMNATGVFAPLGNFDASASPHTISSKVGLLANRPTPCSDGEEYFATDAYLGQNKSYCVGNTWQQSRIQNQVLTNVVNVYSAGAKQTFVPSASTAGFELSCVSSDPSTPVAGDMWCRSDLKVVRFYDGTTVQSIALSGNFVAAGVDATAGGQVTGLHLATTRSGDLVYYNGTSWTELAGNNFGVSNTVYFFGEGSTGVPSFSNNLTENTATNTMRYNGGGGISSGTVSADTSVSVGVGDPSCGSATGCFGAAEASTAGSPIAGHGYLRNDSGSHLFRVSTNGGSENYMPETTNVGNTGQPCLSNGDGSCTYADPAISVNTVTLFNAVSATGTATSTAQTNPLRSGVGWLAVVLNGITGSPSGCQIALSFNQSASGVTESTPFFTQNITTSAGNSYTGYKIAPQIRLQGDNVVAVFSCSAYPSGGTMSVSFNGRMPVDATGQLLNSAIYDSTGANGVAVRQGGGVGTDYALIVGAQPNSQFAQGLKGSTLNDQAAIQCDKTVTGSDSASGSTQIIAGVGGQSVHVCSLHLYSSSTTAVTAKLVASATSGNACATSPIDFSAAVTLQALASNSPVGTNISPSNVDWNTSATNAGVNNGAVCLNLSAAQAVTYQINYAQF